MTTSDDERPPDDRHQRHRELEAVTMTALGLGRLLMECGARAKVVDAHVVDLARALGVDALETRAGYASLEATARKGDVNSTRMVTVGYHGVNQRLDQRLRRLVDRAEREPMTAAEVDAEIERLRATTPHHPDWLMALAAGVACAAFARLLGADWPAALMTLFAAMIGQGIRAVLRRRKNNVFIITLSVAFVGSLLGGVWAQRAGSATISTAMIGSILMLVPGVPLLNALSDIIEGRPTLGSARAVTVGVILAFATVGAWLAGLVLNVGIAR